VDDCVRGSEHARLAWPKYGMQEDYEELAQGLKIPVVVVLGGPDKVETAERVNERVVQILKKAGADVTLTVLEDVGHQLPVEAPRQLEEIIRNVAR